MAVVALILRLWGINFGLPAIYRPDEDVTVGRAMGVLHGVWDPHFADWPHLYFYVAAVWLSPSKLAGLVSDQASAHLAVRSLDALIGAATVLLVYAFGRRAFGWTAGMIAAASLAVAFLAVRDSHFATTDIPLSFACLAALYVAYRMFDTTTRRRLVLGGASLGIATGIKYNGALVGAAIAVAEELHRRVEHLNLLHAGRRIAIVGFVGLIVLVLSSPYLVLDPAITQQGLGYIFHHLASETVPQIGFVRLVVALWYGLDPPLFLLCFAGVAYAAWRRRPADLILLTFVLVYYAFIGAGHSVFLRYADPLVPPLTILGGRLLADAVIRLRRPKTAMVVMGAALITLALPAIVHDLRYDTLIQQADTRTLAFDWLAQHVPFGARVAIPYKPGPAHDQALIDSRTESVGAVDPYVASFLENRLENQYSIHPLSEDDLQRPSTEFLRQEKVIFVVIARKRPDLGCAPPTLLEQALLASGPPVATFSPTGDRCPDSVVDPIDTYFVPLSGYQDWVRPGPRIRIYRLP